MAKVFKPTVFIPYSVLLDSKHWGVGQVYRLKLVVKQQSIQEQGASFEIIDATSLEVDDQAKKRFLSTDSGLMKT